MDTKPRKGTPEHNSWVAMINRCYRPTATFYRYYGARGIGVCDRWRESFDAFLADMGRKPTPKHTIDRIDNDGNYEPGNCRWATVQEQNSNARSNVRITHEGRTQTITQWARELGLSYEALRYRRMKGMSVAEMLNPVREHPHGEAHAVSKLVASDVHEIRRLGRTPGVTAVDIAKRFSVSPQNIHLILKGRAWRHLAEAPNV